MRLVPSIACALATALALTASIDPTRAADTTSPAAASAADLTGLWKARIRFGPDAHGPLMLMKSPDGWIADFMGRRLTVRRDGDVLTFALPNDQGSFRAHLEPDGGVSHGQWYQPKSAINPWFATGVRFHADGAGRWSGDVRPVDDVVTFYLKIAPRSDGSLGVFIRNPERNLGVFFKADHIERAGDEVRVIGRGPGDAQDAVLMSGVFDPTQGDLRLYLPARGWSFDFGREGDDSDFYPRGRAPQPYHYAPPPARDDGWPVGTLEEAGIDRKGMEAFVETILHTPMDSLEAPQVDGILIARHGKLVFEEYFHGESRDRLHETRSAGKSLTATLVGATIQAGLPVKMSTPVYQTLYDGRPPADLDPRKRAMTLENLETMSSGYWCDDGDPKAPGNEDTMTDQSADPDFWHYTLKVPMAYDPGRIAVYCSANPNLAIGVLTHATGEYAMDLYDRLLGDPLGIDQDVWFVSPSKQPYGGGSARMTPRDYMKLGQLMLNRGTWKGRRVLDADWVKRASSPIYDLNGIKYGYSWWGIDYPYKNRTVHAFFAGGNGGQGVMVIPELDMVVATYAANFASHTGLEIQQGYVPRYILPAVRERGDRTDAAVAPREYKVIYGRRQPPPPSLAQ